MNPPSDGTPTKKQRRAHSQARRCGNPVVREQEQSADTARRAIAKEEPGVQEHESLQRNEQQQERFQGCENVSQNNRQQQGKSHLLDVGGLV